MDRIYLTIFDLSMRPCMYLPIYLYMHTGLSMDDVTDLLTCVHTMNKALIEYMLQHRTLQKNSLATVRVTVHCELLVGPS